MAAFGELLVAWAAWLRQLIPFRIVRDWEQGVRLRAGRVTALLTSTNGLRGTGLHLFWPLIGEVWVLPVLLRVAETTLQTVVTRDGREATISLGVRWQIRDLRALFLAVHDAEDTALDLIRGTAGSLIPGMDWSELPGQLPERMAKEVRARMRGWGVTIHEVYIVNLTASQTLRILAEGGPSIIPGVAMGL